MSGSKATLLIALGGILHCVFFFLSNKHFITNTANIVYYSNFLKEFTHSLYGGNLYPRWLNNAFSGIGAPVFVFYPPLAFYIASILPKSIDGFYIMQTGLATILGLTTFCFTSYVWLKQNTDPLRATIISISLFFSASLFTMVHEYVQISSLWAMAWVPLGLYCIEKWHEKRSFYFLLFFSGVLALILLTHIPSFILFTPFLWLYAYAYGNLKRWQDIVVFAFATVLPFFLTSFYWLPAYLNMVFVYTDRYTLGFSSNEEALSWTFLHLGNAIYTYVVVAAIAIFTMRHASARDIRITRMCIGVIIVSALLVMPISKPLWQHIALLNILQSPERFLSLFIVLELILLLGISRKISPFMLVTLIIIASSLTWASSLNDYNFRRKTSESLSVQNTLHKTLDSNVISSEYYTIWNPIKSNSVDLASLIYQSVPQAKIIRGSGNVEVVQWQDENIVLHASATTPLSIQIRQQFFPGWESYSNGLNLPVHPTDNGLLHIDVPKGNYDITVTFSNLQGAKEGKIISCITFLLLIVMGVFNRRRQSLVTGSNDLEKSPITDSSAGPF